PYRGLVPFDGSELDALLFFGRERECDMIAANVVAARLTVLYGPSGVGKSSILRAGVAHRLREEPGAGGGPPDVSIVDSWAAVRPLDTYSALVEPADRITIESALVDAVLEQVTWGRVELGHRGRGGVGAGVDADRVEAAYLQLVMERVWEEERRAGSPRLRLETLEALGGAEQIVREHLERALRALSPAAQGRAARMFHHLVTPTGMKIAHRAGDLARYAGADEAEVAPVLARLTEARVLRPVAG